MPFKVRTLIEDHLLLVTAWGVLTSEELRDFDVQFCTLFDRSAGPTPIHVIYDWTQLDAIPPLADLATVRMARHPRSGWALFIGVKHVVIRFLVGVASQIFQHRIRFFDRPAEALTFLASVDPTLPELKELAALLNAEQDALNPPEIRSQI